MELVFRFIFVAQGCIHYIILQGVFFPDIVRFVKTFVRLSKDYSNLVENALKVRRETSRSLAKIEETTKSCPGCQSPTEKAGNYAG